MSKRPTQARPLMAEPPPQAPPTLGVTQFAMIFTPTEILITLGQSRVATPIGPNGLASPVQMIEWVQTLSIPPGVAQLMREALAGGLEQYEKTFGKIPVDPTNKVVVGVGGTPSKL